VFTVCQVCLLVKETVEIEIGMAEKSSWDETNIRQKLGLVWRNRKKISQIIKDNFYLPFFLNYFMIGGRGLPSGYTFVTHLWSTTVWASGTVIGNIFAMKFKKKK
jgi:hypothetical protein